MQRVRVRVPLQLYSTNTCPQKVRERVPLQLPSTYTYPQRVQSTSTPRAVFNEYRVRIPLELSSTSTEYEYPSSCLQRVQSTSTPRAVFNEYRVRIPLELSSTSTEYEYPSSFLEGVRNERCVDVKTRVFHMHIHTNTHFTCLLNTGECLLTERHLVSPSYHPRVYSSSRSLRG